MLLGIVGLNGSGKDSVALILKEDYGFEHKDFGQAIRDELKVLGKNHLDRSEMIVLGNKRREEVGANYWAKELLKDYSDEKKLVLTSIRNPLEAQEIKSKNGVLIEVFCDINERYKRTVNRVKQDVNAHGDISSFKDFKAKEERELKSDDPSKQQLLKCIEVAEYKIDNSGSFEDLKEQIKKLSEKLNF